VNEFLIPFYPDWMFEEEAMVAANHWKTILVSTCSNYCIKSTLVCGFWQVLVLHPSSNDGDDISGLDVWENYVM
jgi:hypothetical protein